MPRGGNSPSDDASPTVSTMRRSTRIQALASQSSPRQEPSPRQQTEVDSSNQEPQCGFDAPVLASYSANTTEIVENEEAKEDAAIEAMWARRTSSAGARRPQRGRPPRRASTNGSQIPAGNPVPPENVPGTGVVEGPNEGGPDPDELQAPLLPPPAIPRMPCPILTCTACFERYQTLVHHLNTALHADVTEPVQGYPRCSRCNKFCKGANGLAMHFRSCPALGNRNQAPPNRGHIVIPREEPPALRAPYIAIGGIDPPDTTALRSFCSTKLFLLNTSWREPFHRITNSLTHVIGTTEDEETLTQSTLALFVLPGVIAKLNIYRRFLQTTFRGRLPDAPTPIAILNYFILFANPADEILKFARHLLTIFPAADANWPGRIRGTDINSVMRRMEKRVEGSCEVGQISKAARVLDALANIMSRDEPNPPLPVDPRIMSERIRPLFPDANAEDDLRGDDAEGERAPALELDFQTVRRTLHKLSQDKASGLSGWTTKLLKQVAKMGPNDDQETFAIRLTRVFNRILSGNMPASVRGLWTEPVMTLIPKSNNSYRPIGIGEVFYRVLGSSVMATIGHRVGQALLPRQLAVGISGGVEIAAVMADLGYALHRGNLGVSRLTGGFATMNIDICNAFNSIRRTHILTGLRRYAPDVIPHFQWVYGRGIPLRDHRGEHVGMAATGCLQGDPLSTLFFSVALQPFLDEIAHEMAEIERPMPEGVATQGLIFAIADDVTIMAHTPVLLRLAPLVSSIFARAELNVNLSKSFILAGFVPDNCDVPEGWRILDDSGKTLGRPMGSLETQEAWIRQRLLDRAPPENALGRIKTRCAFLLLREAYNHRFDYLRKVTSVRIDPHIFREHDSRVTDCLVNITGADNSARVEVLRELPIHVGGLGIPTITGNVAARQQLITWKRVQVFLSLHHPGLLPVHNTYYRHGEILEMEDQASQLEDVNITDPILRFSRSLAEALEGIHRAQAALLHGSMAMEPLTAHWAALFLSMQNSYGGRWLTTSATVARYSGTHFPDRDYREALRLRMMVPFVPATRGPTLCTCNRAHGIVNLAADSCHPLLCTRSRGLITERHDTVRKLLAKLLRAALPGVLVVEEPRPRQGEPPLRHQPDIGFETAGTRYLIDVVVAEPTSRSATTHASLSSVETKAGAARQAEARKRQDYGVLPEGTRLVPFAIEATGQLGPEAADFLGLVARDQIKPLNYFMRNLAIILAAYSGRLLSYCRGRIGNPPADY